MIVCATRDICADLYTRIPRSGRSGVTMTCKGKVKVVYSGGPGTR